MRSGNTRHRETHITVTPPAAKLDQVHFFPLPKMDPPGFRQRNWTRSTFFPCQKWTRLQRNWTRSTFFPCQKWTRLDFGSETGPGPLFSLAKNGPACSETGPGPLFSLAKNGPAWISAAKLDRVHFFPLPRMDLPGFRQRNWTGSTFSPCQEWTCPDFGSETGPGPLFSPAKNGPAWILAAKLDRVHLFPLPRMDLPGFWQRNWTGSTFFPCQEWTCLDFDNETGPGPPFSPAKNGPAWISAAKLDRVHFFPLPRMDLPGFWQRNWTGSTFFPCQEWTCLDFDNETGLGPLFSRQNWTRFTFGKGGPLLAEKSGPPGPFFSAKIGPGVHFFPGPLLV